MRRMWFGCVLLFGVALVGCGGIDKSVEAPKNPDPLPAEGPSSMSGPAAPPAVDPPK